MISALTDQIFLVNYSKTEKFRERRCSLRSPYSLFIVTAPYVPLCFNLLNVLLHNTDLIDLMFMGMFFSGKVNILKV